MQPAEVHQQEPETLPSRPNHLVWPGAALMPELSSNAPVDFLLITVLDDERKALLKSLTHYRRVPARQDDIHIYYEAIIPVCSPDGFAGAYRAIVCQIPSMGRVRAAAATRDFVQRWHPRYLMLVGIAGGIASAGVARGDVLVATQIADYELQKLTPTEPKIRWAVYHADERLCNAARHLEDTWQQPDSVTRPEIGVPRRHFGSVASGDKVIASEQDLQQLCVHWLEPIGVEMEAAGVAAANMQSPTPLPLFMVRGISDLADEAKSDDWRQYACSIAAAYTVTLLESGPVPTSVQWQSPGAADSRSVGTAAAAGKPNRTTPSVRTSPARIPQVCPRRSRLPRIA